ncbi:pentapeptide repeat-containing protein [Paenibacillus sp. SAF-054]|uniref:pentapeptide repeat-containing protein n=1 Tax=unclassified Paenibacillus TaxID=185978 RepID=UPI003F7EA64A
MSMDPHVSNHINRDHLKADCSNCFGLCCVALPFAASSDFAFDKNAGTPCRNLQSDFRCGVHDSLRNRGMRGCTVYDCFGAGQKISQATYAGRDWRQSPEMAHEMFEAFPVMWQLHELLWYLNEAITLEAAKPLFKDLSHALRATEQLTDLDPGSLLQLDVAAHRAGINEILLRTSELVRNQAKRSSKGPEKRHRIASRGADLISAKLNNADLRFHSLRGAYLIAADLRGADMRFTDLIGADFRDADISGADLTGSLFLTQAQVNAAKGDYHTRIPAALARPAHWNCH